MGGEVGESRGRRKHNQDIPCEREEKKKLFSKKEKKNENIWELDKNIISLPSDAG